MGTELIQKSHFNPGSRFSALDRRFNNPQNRHRIFGIYHKRISIDNCMIQVIMQYRIVAGYGPHFFLNYTGFRNPGQCTVHFRLVLSPMLHGRTFSGNQRTFLHIHAIFDKTAFRSIHRIVGTGHGYYFTGSKAYL